MSLPLPGPDDGLLLLHNPRCSKSRATQALLDERGVSFGVRPYLDEALSAAELEDLGRRLGKPASEWVRKGEAAYQEAGLSAQSSDSELRGAMVRHPILMERPILVSAKQAAVGRPPENVLALL